MVVVVAVVVVVVVQINFHVDASFVRIRTCFKPIGLGFGVIFKFALMPNGTNYLAVKTIGARKEAILIE